MLHEIAPHKFHNSYDYNRTPVSTDGLLVFLNNNVALKILENGKVEIPKVMDFNVNEKLYFLFCVDEVAYYTSMESVEACGEGIEWKPFSIYREVENYIGHIITTAWHIFNWKKDNSFCGRCAKKMTDSHTERGLICPECGNIVYPKISPAVAVAIIDGDRILLARNAQGNFRKFALIAGYVEIGESLEETVRREVMEEVGLKVSHIKYYKSSPWGSSGAQMIGFYAKLEGDSKITLQEEELAQAKWFSRSEIDPNLDELSLSFEMIARFRDGITEGMFDGE